MSKTAISKEVIQEIKDLHKVFVLIIVYYF